MPVKTSALWFAVAVLLVGCSPEAPFEGGKACKTHGDTFARLVAEDDRDCYCLGAQAREAAAHLVDAGLVPADFDFSGVTIYVRAANSRLEPLWPHSTTPRARYVPTGELTGYVETSRYLDALVHELYHHVEHVQGKPLPWDISEEEAHAEWEELGVNDAATKWDGADHVCR